MIKAEQKPIDEILRYLRYRTGAFFAFYKTPTEREVHVLEGVLEKPDSRGPFPAVAVCHPHPRYGGDMYNNVVSVICQALAQESIATLRFNFRGVGASQGKFSNGAGEKEDAIAAISCLSSLKAVDKDRIGLCGYSFGGAVSLEVAPGDARVKALALISPDISTYLPLKHYTSPKLIVCGGAD
mgnify:CR=1 FL=1